MTTITDGEPKSIDQLVGELTQLVNSKETLYQSEKERRLEVEDELLAVKDELLAVKDELSALKGKYEILERQIRQGKPLVRSQNDNAQGTNQVIHHIRDTMGEFISNCIPLIAIVPAFLLLRRII